MVTWNVMDSSWIIIQKKTVNLKVLHPHLEYSQKKETLPITNQETQITEM